jgi:hypothetical protein
VGEGEIPETAPKGPARQRLLFDKVVNGELAFRGSDPPARSMLRPASSLARSITVVGRIRGQVLVKNLKRVGRPARGVLPECSSTP